MPVSQRRLGETAAIADEDIDTTDIPEADEAWFEGAKLVHPPGGVCTGGTRRQRGEAALGSHDRGAEPTPHARSADPRYTRSGA